VGAANSEQSRGICKKNLRMETDDWRCSPLVSVEQIMRERERERERVSERIERDLPA